jgi:hypothetical protein
MTEATRAEEENRTGRRQKNRQLTIEERKPSKKLWLHLGRTTWDPGPEEKSLHWHTADETM